MQTTQGTSQVADLAVVGAGIVGLATAWAAARAGARVVVVERSGAARGATVRNFGMVWPIGQPVGEALDLALRSRALWLEARESAGFWAAECGSLHLAREDDEVAVLEEFLGAESDARPGAAWWDADQVRRSSPAARVDGLRGALWSPSELCVDPREVPSALAGWLARDHGVEFRFGTAAARVEPGALVLASGDVVRARHVVVASGADLETLLPEHFASAPLVRCKLQMLRTAPQPGGFRIGPHLAGGLTLRHYANFGACPSLPALRARVTAEAPDLDRYGVHVMASQHAAGEVTLGDSHEYGDVFAPGSSTRIDELILTELARMIELPTWEIAERWSGVYAKCSTGFCHEAQPQEGVSVLTGLGGAGMTMSFAVAERHVARFVPEFVG